MNDDFGFPGGGSGSGFGGSFPVDAAVPRFVDAGAPFFGDGGVPFPQPPARDAGPAPAPPPRGHYSGCAPVAAPPSCEQLDSASCSSDRRCELVTQPCSCETSFQQNVGVSMTSQPPLFCNIGNCVAPGENSRCQTRSCESTGNAQTCGSLPNCFWDGGSCRPTQVNPCAGLNEQACFARRDCRAVGGPGFCSPYQSCDRDTENDIGTFFIGCEPEPTLRGGCRNDDECASGTVCQEAAGCDPSDPACGGRCVPANGCVNLNQQTCTTRNGCAPRFQPVCVPPPGTPPSQVPQNGSPYDPGSQQQGGQVPVACVPTQVFVGCDDLAGEIVPDRSLAILEPAVLDDGRYSFVNMMTRLAGGGDPRAMFENLVGTLTTNTTINGRLAVARDRFRIAVAMAGPTTSTLDALQFRPVAIMNRLDLVSAEDCGEARIVFASDLGTFDPSRRMTVIMEFGVPSDGQGCRSIARRWTELSQLSPTSIEFQNKLAALTDELFRADRLNQLRTNELMMAVPFRADWELREFKLDNGVLVPRGVANSPGLPRDEVAFNAWLRANQVAIALGTAKMPQEFLAATSIAVPELRTSIPQFPDLEGALNLNTCAGCHRSETATDFVHLSERRFAGGRSMPSVFLRGELVKRGRVLQQLLGDSAPATVLRTRKRPVVH